MSDHFFKTKQALSFLIKNGLWHIEIGMKFAFVRIYMGFYQIIKFINM